MSTIHIGAVVKIPTRTCLRFGGRRFTVVAINENCVRGHLRDGLGLRKTVSYCRASLEGAGFTVAPPRPPEQRP